MAKFHKVPIVKRIKLDDYKSNTLSYRWLHLVSNGIAQPIYIPVIIGKGVKEGPVLGLTAVVHGNELNGMSVIQRLFNSVNLEKLSGTIIGIPVVNVPSILVNERRFVDGVDLNRVMPGEKNGNRSKVYASRIIDRIVNKFDYLLDLHTASFGRVNSYYVRADLSSKLAKQLALIQNPQIILNTPPKDGTLRGAAADLGIHAITIEVGDPDKFQRGMIRSSLTGVYNTLSFLNMYNVSIDKTEKKAVICKKSYWIYSHVGGVIQVHVELKQYLQKGELIATVRDVFGNKLKEYVAPEDGVVIGKSTNPIGQTGSRLIHLGVLK